MKQIPVDWPFNPRRVPFFYGWVIWGISTLGFLMSIPGQTMGMAVFTDPFIDATGLTRTELSLAYLFGTVGSAFFLTRAGGWYDRYGGRFMIAASSFMLGGMVMFLSFVDSITQLLGGGAFVLMLLGYFGVRFFGQGVLTSCANNVLLLWFVKRRGLVTGIRGIFVSFGFSVAPLGLAYLILEFGWRGTLWFLAAIVGIGFASLALVFIRDNPASMGLAADGGSIEASDKTNLENSSKTMREARKDPVFWIYTISLSMHALFGTALTFHVVSIFAEAGRSREEAFGYFFPSAVFATATNLFASWLVDRHRLKPFLIVMLMAFIAGAFGLLNLDKAWGFWLLAAGFGGGSGLWVVISNLAFIRFYGPLNLGSISGLSTSFAVFGSAVGPAAFSLGLDAFGSYEAGIMMCLTLLVLLLVTAIAMPQKEVS
jgi:OFA family oxalate/formate antiporter-like MFS transporter